MNRRNRTSGRSRLRTGMVLLALVLGVSAALLAHEGHHHEAKGTVKAIEASKLDLTTTDGQEKSFILSAATKFKRGASEVRREEISVGERAVVMYESQDGADRAIEVKLAEKKS